MKKYITDSEHNKIPNIEFTVDIYSLDYFNSASIPEEDLKKLPEVTDRYGNVISTEWLKEYECFIQDVENYLNSLNIRMIDCHHSADSASCYYLFHLLDENKSPIIEVRYIIRISDHLPGKKLRNNDFVSMQVKKSHDSYAKIYSFRFITPLSESYRICLDRLRFETDMFQKNISDEYYES